MAPANLLHLIKKQSLACTHSHRYENYHNQTDLLNLKNYITSVRFLQLTHNSNINVTPCHNNIVKLFHILKLQLSKVHSIT